MGAVKPPGVDADDRLMGAGDSARREYERRLVRHKAKVRRTIPVLAAMLVVAVPGAWILGERFLPGAGGWVALVVAIGLVAEMWPGRAHVDSWRTGGTGESKVGKALSALGPAYEVLHDRRIPGSRANIDHVVVGPTGVFVIETKNVAGKVRVVRGELRVAGRRKGFAEQAWREAAAVQAALAPQLASLALDVRPLLCFLKADLPWSKTTIDGVPLLYPKGVVRTIAASPRCLDPTQVQALAQQLQAVLKPA